MWNTDPQRTPDAGRETTTPESGETAGASWDPSEPRILTACLTHARSPLARVLAGAVGGIASCGVEDAIR